MSAVHHVIGELDSEKDGKEENVIKYKAAVGCREFCGFYCKFKEPLMSKIIQKNGLVLSKDDAIYNFVKNVIDTKSLKLYGKDNLGLDDI